MRILLAEDQDLVAEAFEALLATAPEIEVVERVGRGDLVVDAVRRHTPDVAILDVDMPGLTGIEAAAQIQTAGLPCRVLLLTALPGSGHLHRALAAGVNGYLMKSTTGDRLIAAIRSVAAGGTVIDPALAADALRRGPSPLSDRETEILRLVDRGATTGVIARQLFLSHGTVRNYLSHVMTKLDVSTRQDAVRKAHREGWI